MEAEIKITIKDKRVDITSNIQHDDVVMFYLIESIYQLRNRQYEKLVQCKDLGSSLKDFK